MLLPAIATVRSNASRRVNLLVIRLHPARGRNPAILASQAAPDKQVCAELHRQMIDFLCLPAADRLSCLYDSNHLIFARAMEEPDVERTMAEDRMQSLLHQLRP